MGHDRGACTPQLQIGSVPNKQGSSTAIYVLFKIVTSWMSAFNSSLRVFNSPSSPPPPPTQTSFSLTSGDSTTVQSPYIYRLLNEIISAILEFTAHCPTIQFLPTCVRAPTNVSHVSRRWRDIAMATPTLSTSNKISVNSKFLQILLARSRSAPLDINLTLPSAWPDNVPIVHQQSLMHAQEALIRLFSRSVHELSTQMALWRTFAIRGLQKLTDFSCILLSCLRRSTLTASPFIVMMGYEVSAAGRCLRGAHPACTISAWSIYMYPS
ncbi:hypothetical protein BOTBODRAFT_254471, partial [Botryobasidium botryosum FD-172 SS1]